jgi:hypothetical protein
LVEAEHHFPETFQTFASSLAQFEVDRIYLDLATSVQGWEDRDTVPVCLGKAQQLFCTL